MTLSLTSKNFQKEVTDSTGVVIVDFSATWCGPCQILKPILEEIVQETGVKLGVVDIDDEDGLADQYNITSVPTLVFFKDGKAKKKISGVQPKSKLIKGIEKLRGE